MSLLDLGSVFLLGLLGTGHCVGMCGAFALAVTAGARSPGTLVWRQVSYHLGKATSYLFLGVLLLVASTWLAGRNPVTPLQTVLGWGVGLAMILMGIAYACEWRGPGGLGRWWAGSASCGSLAALWQSPSLLKSLLAGWINGFLPCGLSLMAILFLVGTQSAATLVVGTYVFGFATLPGLLAVSLVGQRLSLKSRRWLVRVGGVALVMLGVLTVVRGDPSVHGWFHENLIIPSGGGHGGHEHSPSPPRPPE